MADIELAIGCDDEIIADEWEDLARQDTIVLVKAARVLGHEYEDDES